MSSDKWTGRMLFRDPVSSDYGIKKLYLQLFSVLSYDL